MTVLGHLDRCKRQEDPRSFALAPSKLGKERSQPTPAGSTSPRPLVSFASPAVGIMLDLSWTCSFWAPGFSSAFVPSAFAVAGPPASSRRAATANQRLLMESILPMRRPRARGLP
jgi:hypothetical protein